MKFLPSIRSRLSFPWELLVICSFPLMIAAYGLNRPYDSWPDQDLLWLKEGLLRFNGIDSGYSDHPGAFWILCSFLLLKLFSWFGLYPGNHFPISVREAQYVIYSLRFISGVAQALLIIISYYLFCLLFRSRLHSALGSLPVALSLATIENTLIIRHESLSILFLLLSCLLLGYLFNENYGFVRRAFLFATASFMLFMAFYCKIQILVILPFCICYAAFYIFNFLTGNKCSMIGFLATLSRTKPNILLLPAVASLYFCSYISTLSVLATSPSISQNYPYLQGYAPLFAIVLSPLYIFYCLTSAQLASAFALWFTIILSLMILGYLSIQKFYPSMRSMIIAVLLTLMPIFSAQFLFDPKWNRTVFTLFSGYYGYSDNIPKGLDQYSISIFGLFFVYILLISLFHLSFVVGASTSRLSFCCNSISAILPLTILFAWIISSTHTRTFYGNYLVVPTSFYAILLLQSRPHYALNLKAVGSSYSLISCIYSLLLIALMTICGASHMLHLPHFLELRQDRVALCYDQVISPYMALTSVSTCPNMSNY